MTQPTKRKRIYRPAIIRRWNNGYLVSTIARELNRSENEVKWVLHQAGVPMVTLDTKGSR